MAKRYPNLRRDSDGRFLPGSGGRPPGARNKATLAAEALLCGAAERITAVCVEKALEGDVTAIRLVLERLVAPQRDRHVSFAMPPLDRPGAAVQALAAVAEAAAGGEITPGEANDLAALVSKWSEARATADLAARLDRLEAALGLQEGGDEQNGSGETPGQA